MEGKISKSDAINLQKKESVQRRDAHSSMAVTEHLVKKLFEPPGGKRAKSSLGLTVDPEVTKQGMARREDVRRGKAMTERINASADEFDILLTMTAKEGVMVREQSVMLDMQRDFRAKWDQVSSERPVIKDERAFVAGSPALKKGNKKGKYFLGGQGF